VGGLMDKSLSCVRKWLKMMMKLAIAIVEKGNELVKKKINNIGFCVDDH
jgi:hypothetical protein